MRAFGRAYNAEWLIERHSFRTPIEAREHPDPSGGHGMIALFTKVSGEPGAAHGHT